MNMRIDFHSLMAGVSEGDVYARLILALMVSVFEDFIQDCTAEVFAKRFGSLGTEALAKYGKQN